MNFLKIILLYLAISISYIFPNWFGSDVGISHIPIQESGRVKPLDTYARNQLLLFYGKEYIDADDTPDNIRIEAIARVMPKIQAFDLDIF